MRIVYMLVQPLLALSQDQSQTTCSRYRGGPPYSPYPIALSATGYSLTPASSPAVCLQRLLIPSWLHTCAWRIGPDRKTNHALPRYDIAS